MKQFTLIFQLVFKAESFLEMSAFLQVMNIHALNPMPNYRLKSMCLRCDLANYVPHFSPKKILPPLKHRPSYGVDMMPKISLATTTIWLLRPYTWKGYAQGVAHLNLILILTSTSQQQPLSLARIRAFPWQMASKHSQCNLGVIQKVHNSGGVGYAPFL